MGFRSALEHFEGPLLVGYCFKTDKDKTFEHCRKISKLFWNISKLFWFLFFLRLPLNTIGPTQVRGTRHQEYEQKGRTIVDVSWMCNNEGRVSSQSNDTGLCWHVGCIGCIILKLAPVTNINIQYYYAVFLRSSTSLSICKGYTQTEICNSRSW